LKKTALRVRNREYLSRKRVVSAIKAGSVSLVPFGAYQKAPSFHPLNQHPPINKPNLLGLLKSILKIKRRKNEFRVGSRQFSGVRRNPEAGPIASTPLFIMGWTSTVERIGWLCRLVAASAQIKRRKNEGKNL
jgi:hypothetical protein|tara:strand:- start:694 stop:1092 length:399 start_codon:yes stop_codon:yes gene_type:complete